LNQPRKPIKKDATLWRIPLFKIAWSEGDVDAVSEVIRSGMNWASGPHLKRFEEIVSKYVGTRYCVALNSGTSALQTSLLAHGVGPEDEVIVPSFTFIATANAVLQVGAKPVFADIETETMGLDPDEVAKKVTTKTKAIIPVHYGGCPCRIEELKELAEERKLILIEDAAEAIGASVNGRKVGTFGDSAVLSFAQNKVVTTGEGGAVITNSKKVFEKARLVRSHGRLDPPGGYFGAVGSGSYVSMGYNYRLSDVLAALGISQMHRINRIIKTRQQKAKLMTSLLRRVKGVITPITPPGCQHVYQLYTVRVPKSMRRPVQEHLANMGIMSKVYFEPIHLTPFYSKRLHYQGGDLPATEQVSQEVLSLPLYPALSAREAGSVAREMAVAMGGSK